MPKTALVTGASSGIGRETAFLLAERGWTLALTARRKDRLSDAAETIEKSGSPRPLVVPADLSHPDQARAAVEKTVAHFGRLDVLVNNAGLLRMAPFMDMPVDEMREMFEVNFWATIETVRAAVPVMEKQGGGRIVQVGSGASRRALPYMAAYAASKFALVGLTEGLRIELAAKNIEFSLVLPGGVDTDMPRTLDRSRLPNTYPSNEGLRISARRAAKAVVNAIESGKVETHVPWWITPGLWMSALVPPIVDRVLLRRYRLEAGDGAEGTER